MIAPLLLAISAYQAQDAPIQKQTMPNGAVLYAEEMPKARGFSLHFFISTLGHPEPASMTGQRHLLEHLLAKGQNRDLDAKLEVLGVSLSADTLRDGIRFEIEGPGEQLNFAIESLRELVTKPTFKKEEIENELKVMNQEFALRTVNSRLSAAIWEHAYGEKESDPYGTEEGLAAATPESLGAVFNNLFKPSSMTVTVVGAIDAGEAMSAMKEIFSKLEGTVTTERADREPASNNSVGFAKNTPGVGRAVYVPSLDHASTLPVLAAAMALSMDIEGSSVVYTPTPLGGLVSIVHPRRTGLAGLDTSIRGAPQRLYGLGRAALRVYFDTIDAQSREKARLYGQMLLLQRSFKIDSVKHQASLVSQSQFRTALQKFHTSNAIRVGGTR